MPYVKTAIAAQLEIAIIRELKALTGGGSPGDVDSSHKDFAKAISIAVAEVLEKTLQGVQVAPGIPTAGGPTSAPGKLI